MVNVQRISQQTNTLRFRISKLNLSVFVLCVTRGLRLGYDITGTGSSQRQGRPLVACFRKCPVTAYLSHLSSWCVGVRGPAAIASTYKVWWVASSARVGGPALLGLHLTLWGALCPLAAALVTAAWLSFSLSLAITLVVLRVVAAGWAPPAGIPPVTVPVSCVLASLDWNTPWASDVGCLGSLEGLEDIAQVNKKQVYTSAQCMLW